MSAKAAAGASRSMAVNGPSARRAPQPGRHEAIEDALDIFSLGAGLNDDQLLFRRNQGSSRRQHVNITEENKRLMSKMREDWLSKYIPPPKCTRWEAFCMLFSSKYKDGILKAAAKVKDEVDKEEERKSIRLSNGRRPKRKK